MLSYILVGVVSAVVGAAAMFGGLWLHDRLVYGSPNWPSPPVKDDSPPKAKCACGHLRSMHTDATGKCQAAHNFHSPDGARCACQLYDGPIPLMTVHYTEPVPNGEH